MKRTSTDFKKVLLVMFTAFTLVLGQIPLQAFAGSGEPPATPAQQEQGEAGGEGGAAGKAQPQDQGQEDDGQGQPGQQQQAKEQEGSGEQQLQLQGQEEPRQSGAQMLGNTRGGPVALDAPDLKVGDLVAGEAVPSVTGLVATPPGANYGVVNTIWSDSDGNNAFEPTSIEAGETYYVTAIVDAYEGYYFPDSTSSNPTVTGGTLVGNAKITNSPADAPTYSSMSATIAITGKSSTPAETVNVSVTPKNLADFQPAYGAGTVTINGQLTESATVEKGSPVTLQATAAPGWEFVRWYIGSSQTDNPYTFTALGNTNVTAYFQATETCTVTLEGGDHGGTLGTLKVPAHSSISTTYADTWYKGADEFDTFYKTLADGSKTYRVDHYTTATGEDFDADTEVEGDITVYASWNEQIDSASITFTAPDAGTTVTSAKTDWGATQFPTPSVSVPSGAHYAFGQDDDYPNGTSLYLSSLPSGDPRDDLLNGTMDADTTYYFNSWLVADDGYFFADDVQLSVSGATLSSADLTGADGKGLDVYASFTPAAASAPCDVKLTVNNLTYGKILASYTAADGGTVTDAEIWTETISVKAGTDVTVTAAPSANYSLQGWYDFTGDTKGSLLASSSSYTFTASSDMGVLAEFETVDWVYIYTGCSDGGTYAVARPSGTQSGISGNRAYRESSGDELTLTASPSTGHVFEGWYKMVNEAPTDELVSSDDELTLALTSLIDETGYYAKFAEQPQRTIKTGSVGNGSYTASIDGTEVEGSPFTQKNFDAPDGAQVTLAASPESGSTFVGWWPGWINSSSGLVTNARNNLSAISTEPTLTFTASEPDSTDVVQNAYCAVFATQDQLLDDINLKVDTLYEGVATAPAATYNGTGAAPYNVNVASTMICPAGSDVPLIAHGDKTVAGQQYDILVTCSANSGYMWSQGENAIAYDIENGSLVEGSPNVRLSSVNFKVRITAQAEGSHRITVAGGTADKEYAQAGDTVTLTAVAPDWPAGDPVFAEWGVKAASELSQPARYTTATTTITMPDDDVTAIASYNVWNDETTDDSTVIFDGNLTMTDTARNTETFNGDVFDKTINVHYTRTAEDNANITTQVNAMRDALTTKAQEIYNANNGWDYVGYDTNSISNETTWDHRRYETVEYNMDSEVAPETGTWEKTTPMIKQHNATGGYGKSQTYKTDRDGTYKGLVSLGVGGSEGGTFAVAPTSGGDQYFSGGEGTANYYLVYNTSVTATATPATGYNFVGWYTGTYTDGFVKGHTDALLSQNPTYTFDATADDTPIYALFEADNPTLTVTCSAYMNVGNMLASVTVNGVPLTMSDPPDTGLIYSDSNKIGITKIAAGTPVTVVITSTENATVYGFSHPSVDYTASMSSDGGSLTMSFEMPNGDLNFDAYLSNAVLVTYDVNGGTPGENWPANNTYKMATSMAAVGLPITADNFADLATPPTGLAYGGIEVTYDGGTTTVEPGQVLSGATFRNGGNIKWLWEGGKTLHFDANGGDGEMADVTVAEGEEYQLPECGFDASWKMFDHWEVTVGDGQPMSKQPGETVVMSDDAVAKAVWKDAAMLVISIVGNGYEDSAWNHATVTLDGVEVTKPETGPAVGIKVAVGSTHTVVIAPANGYTVTQAGLGDEDIAPDADGKATIEIPEVQSTGLIISGAEVEPVYTVSFDTNGADPPEMADQKVAYGGHAKEPSVETNEAAPVKGNLVLRGWYKDVSLTEPFDFANDTIDSSITLYAGWDVPVKLDVVNLDSGIVNGTGGSATITYDDVTVTAPTQDFVYLPEGKTVTLTATPDADGHFAFNSWRTGSTADSPAVTTVPEGKYGNETCNVYVNQFLDSATIYALFELETCTVTFNAHNGETTHATQQVKYGQYATKLSPDPDRTAARPGNPNYHPVLNTWQTEEGAHDSAFDFRNTPVTSDIELHAEWGFTMEATGYNMVTGAVADNSGGKLSWNDSTYTDTAASYSSEGTELTVYSKPDDGYIFRGWAYGDNKDQMLSDTPVYTANIEEMPERFYALFDYPHVNFDAGEHGTKGTGWVDYVSAPKGEVFGPDQTAIIMIEHFLEDDVIVPEEGYRPVGLKITPAEGDPITLGLDDDIDYRVDNDVTVEVLWATSPVTLHFSSVYGDDLVAPISFNVADPDTGIENAINAHFGTDEGFDYEPFALAGYEDYGYRMPKSMSEYSSTDDLLDNHLHAADKVGENGLDVYYTMYKVVDTVELSYGSAPVCGTSTTTEENTQSILRWDWETQTNPPVASTSGETYGIEDYEGAPYSFWTLSRDEDTPYIGGFEGGRQYLANTSLKADYGYVFADEVSVTVNGAELVEAVPDCIRVYVYSMLTAAHVPGDPVRENEIAPTCTEPGSYDMVTYCTECSAPISATQAVIQPLGHDWGEWKVVKEPTTSSAGIEERTCSRCEAKETRDIPALDGTYKFVEGDGAVWDKGSSDGLTFRIKRTEADELSFDRFTGLKVDGNDVPVYAYDKQKGSVIVTLKPFFLYGLDEGEHTIDATFDDSTDGAHATFTVKAASSKYGYAGRHGSVKTGDVLGVGVAVLAGVALVALGALVYIRRKRNR